MTESLATARTPQLPPQSEWPAEGVEQVPNCPICGSARREILHDQLRDNVFFAAPGSWSLWRCTTCRSAYLDPRPTEETIGLAYSTYYTHDEPPPAPPRSAIARIQNRLANGYRNWRYGTRFSPASPLGVVVALMVPPLALKIDIAYRFLPPLPKAGTLRVLDVGCGGGDWLTTVQRAGYSVAGLEPDPASRQRAEHRNIEVRQELDDWLDQSGTFDFITMNHVIEHVHNPVEVLRRCLKLLRPGGGIFVETPNIDAIGHRIYGRNWRGLEPPRHLVLFTRESLKLGLREAGFQDIRWRPRPSPFKGMSEQSRRMAAGLDPLSDQDPIDAGPTPDLRSRLGAMFNRRASEFMTLTAARP